MSCLVQVRPSYVRSGGGGAGGCEGGCACTRECWLQHACRKSEPVCRTTAKHCNAFTEQFIERLRNRHRAFDAMAMVASNHCVSTAVQRSDHWLFLGNLKQVVGFCLDKDRGLAKVYGRRCALETRKAEMVTRQTDIGRWDLTSWKVPGGKHVKASRNGSWLQLHT